jgi:hypothetical protein
MIKKNENPNRKIGISEAEYAKARRDNKRLHIIKKAIKPINEVLKNLK